MKRCFILALFLIILSAPVLGAWQVIKKWEGNGIISTESFYIGSKQWRISWDFETQGQFADSAVFQIFLEKEGASLPKVMANQVGQGKGTSYVHSGPGNYHLEINSFFGQWVVLVEEE